MGGWFLIHDSNSNFDDRLAAFRQVFSISHVPPLQIEVTETETETRIVKWAWRADNFFPNLEQTEDPQTGNTILIDGYFTGFGAYAHYLSKGKNKALQLLRLWNEHGTKVVKELNGSFSLCIIPKGGQPVIITDRFASRPVWYASPAADKLYAGNYATALAVTIPGGKQFSAAGLWAGLATSRPVGRNSLFAGIYSLDAGCVGTFRDNTVSESKWFQLAYRPERKVKAREWGHRIATRLKEVAEHFAENQKPYLFLSGGMDSRIAAGAFRQNLHTLTLANNLNMNARLAQRVALAVGADHETVIRNPYDYLHTFEAAGLISGGLYNIAHAHFISPVIQRYQTQAVFFLGDLLENFDKHYFKNEITDPGSVAPECLPENFAKLFGYAHKDFGQFGHLFQPGTGGKLQEAWSSALTNQAQQVRDVASGNEDYLDALFRWSNNMYCPTNLMLECIKPFGNLANLMFDNEMLEILTAIPASMKTKGILHNEILRHLNKKLLRIPNSNFWLPPSFPKELAKTLVRIRPVVGKWRRKITRMYRNGPVIRTEGSWGLRDEWYRHDPQYHAFLDDLFNSKRVFPPEIFDHSYIRQSWQEFQQGNRNRIFEIDMLLSFGVLNKSLGIDTIKF